MGTVVKFPKTIEYINNVPTPAPKTADEYLKLCKKLLTEEDYIEVCVAVLDNDRYEEVDQQIKKIVDSYYSF
jgi:hypothetical protein